MKHIKLFEEINQINQREFYSKKEEEEIDYDSILQRMKDDHGWGDLSPNYLTQFEESEYYTPGCTEDEYLRGFHSWMYDIQTGFIEDPAIGY